MGFCVCKIDFLIRGCKKLSILVGHCLVYWFSDLFLHKLMFRSWLHISMFAWGHILNLNDLCSEIPGSRQICSFKRERERKPGDVEIANDEIGRKISKQKINCKKSAVFCLKSPSNKEQWRNNRLKEINVQFSLFPMTIISGRREGKCMHIGNYSSWY